jgi:prepilin-type N-terminal cleavage/methylation domain-containing protein
MSGIVPGRRGMRGFSMIELLVTIVLAGIIFMAMVPFFANALKTTSRDASRNDAQNITVDRIEQVRLLPYGDITAANLNTPPSPQADFGDGRFGSVYTVASGRPFGIVYQVEPQDNAQKVTVSVTRAGSSNTTIMSTVVKNPEGNEVVSTSGPIPTVLPTENLSITASFKNWADVVRSSTKGVYWTRVQAGTGTTVTSAHIWPTSASSPKCVFTGLLGGANYTYTVSCYSSKWQSGNTPFTSPPFHLMKSARLKFDTNPGGS